MQAEIYDKVGVETKGVKYEGTLMPSQTDRIVLKLKNGYNIGIEKESASIILLDKKEEIPSHPGDRQFERCFQRRLGGLFAADAGCRGGCVGIEHLLPLHGCGGHKW